MTAIIHGTKDGMPFCNYTSDDTFVCPECERTCCYCFGCDDETPDLCDDCRERCPTCEGDGLVVVGWDSDTDKAIEGPCPDCGGSE